MMIDSVNQSSQWTAYLHGDSLVPCLRKSGHPTSWVSHLSACWLHRTLSHCPSHPARVSSFSCAASLIGRAFLCLRSTLLHAIFIWHRSCSSFICHFLCSHTPPSGHHWTVHFLTNKIDVKNSLSILSVCQSTSWLFCLSRSWFTSWWKWVFSPGTVILTTQWNQGEGSGKSDCWVRPVEILVQLFAVVA